MCQLYINASSRIYKNISKLIVAKQLITLFICNLIQTIILRGKGMWEVDVIANQYILNNFT